MTYRHRHLAKLLILRTAKSISDRLLGRADFNSNVVFKEGLKLRATLLPHPRHADLTEWPQDKAHQKDKALALAQNATVHVRPIPFNVL